MRADEGMSQTANSIIEGTYQIEYEISVEMKAFFEAIKMTGAERDQPPVLGSVNTAQFQHMLKIADESTSSDPKGLNYTLWEAMAKSNHISSFLCILVSLPFIYGFVNPHWSNLTDVILEKKPGVRQIHVLRIIGLVSPEFNTMLRYLIGHLAQQNFANTNLCDEKHGFRPRRQAIDAAMLKLLTFESARYMKATMASAQYNNKAGFDRMHRAD